MNFAALEADNAQQRHHRIVIGIAVSLALHALLLSAWRTTAPGAGDKPLAPNRPIAVWLRPLPEPLPEAVQPPGPPARAQAPRAPRRVLAVPRKEQAPARQDAFVVRPPPEPEPAAPQLGGQAAAPRFDPEAARRLARRIAGEPDPAKAGTAVGQFAEKTYETETKAARAIAAAKRGNCKDGIPGGLLAPLVLLLDKKDSGCKW